MPMRFTMATNFVLVFLLVCNMSSRTRAVWWGGGGGGVRIHVLCITKALVNNPASRTPCVSAVRRGD